MDWKDTKGVTSSNCALSTTFTVQPEVLNPDWSIVKGVVEKCVDEKTNNPKSQLTYTITVKNTGEAAGEITKIVDTLDTKVKQIYLSNISNSGDFADGNITWTLSSTDKTFAVNQQKVFTYTVTVPKDGFGKYSNTVTAFPSTGANIVANAEITADCLDIPETGLFDSTLSKIILGVVLIIIGINYSRILAFGSRFSLLVKKFQISISDTREETRKKNFEKKVVKR
jgi:uncharacterized repeat protein (TIGR01451 family)